MFSSNPHYTVSAFLFLAPGNECRQHIKYPTWIERESQKTPFVSSLTLIIAPHTVYFVIM